MNPSDSDSTHSRPTSAPTYQGTGYPPAHHAINSAAEAATRPPEDHPHNPFPQSTNREELDAGVIIAGRYRIISMLGEGGMGRVYRADDLTLGVSVALKFLPRRLTGNQSWLSRFREEVKTARRISHGNVCRVHDIGEHDGLTFLSMEYVDGEDLSSLLRRIGRLPYDKALSVARQICLGVAAAHEAGVLHRDLKPANVMLDGRGNVRLTDFGIAARDGEVASGVAGTPAYMAPEQARGEAPTRQSDIFSLGLVLYELFTGKPAQPANTLAEVRTFHNDLTSGATITVPSSLVNDLDAATERAILRCLDADPTMRPTSAFAVAASLPGGDPLAAALAAGETPSPELVALAGTSGSSGVYLSVRAAFVCSIAAFALIIAIVVGSSRTNVLSRVPTRYSPPVLVEKAKEHLVTLGVNKLHLYTAWGMNYDSEYINWAIANREASTRWDALETGAPRNVLLWLRAQNYEIRPADWFRAAVTRTDPRDDLPDSVNISIDTKGRLVRYARVSPENGWQPQEPAPIKSHADWEPIFAAAGLDISLFNKTDPQRVSFQPSDTRYAWTGVYPDDPQTPLRIEGSSLSGVVTEFRLLPPWRAMSTGIVPQESSVFKRVVLIFGSLLLPIGIGFAIYLARRNIMMGRADRLGAFRLAIFVMVGEVVRMSVARENAFDILSGEILGRHFARGAWAGAMVWLLYLAIEPFVRRFWPQSLVSWMRLLSGKYDDPRVRRDILIGALCGLVVGASLLWVPQITALLSQTKSSMITPYTRELDSLRGSGFLFSTLWNLLNGSVAIVLLFTFLLVGLRQSLRRNWLAYIFGVPLIMGLMNFGESSVQNELICRAIVALACTTIVVRFGLLTACVTSAVFTVTIVLPLNPDLTHWTSTPGLIAFTVIAALIAWCIRGALASQRAPLRTAP